MAFGVNILSGYFSKSARAERAERKFRYSEAIGMLIPMVESRVKGSPAAMTYDRLYGLNDTVLRDIARSVMAEIMDKMKRPEETRSSAKGRAIDLVFQNKENLALGRPLDEKTVNEAREGTYRAKPFQKSCFSCQ